MEYEDARTLLISPHQDDIALSLGGAILSGYFSRPILILNIFTMSSYAPLYSEMHDMFKVSKIRADEDDAFAKSLGLVHIDLGLKDALLRWKLGQDVYPLLAVSSMTRGWPPPHRKVLKRASRSFAKMPITMKAEILQKVVKFDRIYLTVKEAISTILSRCPKATLVSPLSLASQPDHVAVACACRDIDLRPERIYYEDLPYAWRHKMREIRKHVYRFDSKLVPQLIDLNSVFDAKIKNLSYYRSQLDTTEINSVINHAKRIHPGSFFERLWLRRP